MHTLVAEGTTSQAVTVASSNTHTHTGAKGRLRLALAQSSASPSAGCEVRRLPEGSHRDTGGGAGVSVTT